MNNEMVALSKRLSWLLRHGANEAGLAMGPDGWSELDDVLRLLAITRAELADAVTRNDKGRLVVEGSRIRACQGHSPNGAPVTREALEASWEPVAPCGALWHGTRAPAVAGIAREGITCGQRTHVHLAASPDSKVGKRSGVDFLLEISSARIAEAGIAIFRAPNGVVLVRHVPCQAVTGLRPISNTGRVQEEEALRLLGLSRRGGHTGAG